MKKKLFFMKLSGLILLICFLFSLNLFSQTITKEIKKENITTKGTDNKAVNKSNVNTINNPSLTATITAKGIAANAKKYNNINKTSNIVLNFEGLGNLDYINNFYNGGAGTNYGVYFNADALAIISSAYGGTGVFDFNPSGHTIMFFLTGSASVMNVPAGFSTGFSFYYAANVSPVTIYVWDGLDGTGNLLATQTFPVTNNPYYEWLPAGVNFVGLAKSVSFSGAANFCGFDDVTFGSSTPGQQTTTTIPTLSEWGLIIMGFVLLALGAFYIRRRNMLIS